MINPISVSNFTTPMATPFVSLGRMIEHTGRLRLRKGHGSGMIRFVWKVSLPKGAELRSGNGKPFVGSVSGASGVETALPALSDQVSKFMVSVGPILRSIRRTSALLALCAIEG